MARGRAAPDGNGPVLRLVDVGRTYRVGKVDVPALRGVSVEVEAGETVAIVGPSGSGKTTLLNVAGLLDHPDGGEVYLSGTETTALGDKARARLRQEQVGFIFQSFNLLPHLTAEENVALPLRYAEPEAAQRTPAELLERVGLGERRRHRPAELSGGEQQRVAIARALVLDPPLLLADEPTGELDSETAETIHAILDELRAEGKAVVVVTHNPELTEIAGRAVHMRDGLIEDEREARQPPRAPTKRTAKKRTAPSNDAETPSRNRKRSASSRTKKRTTRKRASSTRSRDASSGEGSGTSRRKTSSGQGSGTSRRRKTSSGRGSGTKGGTKGTSSSRRTGGTSSRKPRGS